MNAIVWRLVGCALLGGTIIGLSGCSGDSNAVHVTKGTPAAKPGEVVGGSDAATDALATAYSQLVDLDKKYAEQLRRVQWPTLFDVHRLGTDSELSQSARIVLDARAVRTEAFRRRDSVVDEHRRALADATSDTAGREAALSRFDRGTAPLLADMRELSAAETELVTQSELLVRFLTDHRSAWSVQGDQVTYDNEDDQAQFEVMMNRVIISTEREQEMHRRYVSTLTQAAMQDATRHQSRN